MKWIKKVIIALLGFVNIINRMDLNPKRKVLHADSPYEY